MAEPFDSATDADLLAAARAGNNEALASLLERHQAQIYRFGMKMCRDSADAEDVLQETLLAMARGVREFRGASSISTWLYTVARSFCIKKRRRSKFAPEETSLETSLEASRGASRGADGGAVDPARSPDEALAAKEVGQALEQAIRALDPSQREVLILRDVEGLTAPEVAEIVGITVQAVKSRLHRGARRCMAGTVRAELRRPSGAGILSECAHAVLATPRRRDQCGRVPRNGAASGRVCAVSRRVRFAEADARVVSHDGKRDSGARCGAGGGEARAQGFLWRGLVNCCVRTARSRTLCAGRGSHRRRGP